MNTTLLVALVSTGGLIVVGLISYLGGRFAVKQAARANAETRDQHQEHREADWNAGYRANGEEHLLWDVDRAADIRQLRDIVNRLEVELGHEPTQFDPIPKPPAIFPKFAPEK